MAAAIFKFLFFSLRLTSIVLGPISEVIGLSCNEVTDVCESFSDPLQALLPPAPQSPVNAILMDISVLPTALGIDLLAVLFTQINHWLRLYCKSWKVTNILLCIHYCYMCYSENDREAEITDG